MKSARVAGLVALLGYQSADRHNLQPSFLIRRGLIKQPAMTRGIPASHHDDRRLAMTPKNTIMPGAVPYITIRHMSSPSTKTLRHDAARHSLIVNPVELRNDHASAALIVTGYVAGLSFGSHLFL